MVLFFLVVLFIVYIFIDSYMESKMMEIIELQQKEIDILKKAILKFYDDMK